MAIHMTPIEPNVTDFHAFFCFSSLPSARKSSYAIYSPVPIMTSGSATFRRICSMKLSTSRSHQEVCDHPVRELDGLAPIPILAAKAEEKERDIPRKRRKRYFILYTEVTYEINYTISKTSNDDSDYRIYHSSLSFFKLLIFSYREDHLHPSPCDTDDSEYRSDTDSICDDIRDKIHWCSNYDSIRWGDRSSNCSI
jgi:hypothetical protein